jgi:hypothetical protein
MVQQIPDRLIHAVPFVVDSMTTRSG